MYINIHIYISFYTHAHIHIHIHFLKMKIIKGFSIDKQKNTYLHICLYVFFCIYSRKVMS